MVGLTLFENVPLPVPVTIPPLLLSVSVHAPEAVTVPVIFVLLPLHIDVLPLFIFAVGLEFTVSVAAAEVTEAQPPVETTAV